MTAMTPDVSLLRGSLGTLPRVNLLPPEIGEIRRFRQIQVGLGAAVVASIGVVALMYVSANHSVTAAQSRLDDSTAQSAQIRAESAKYADVTAVYARAATAQQMLVTAMGDEIRFSQLLNDMSMSIPDHVWVTNLAYVSAPPSAAVAGAAPSTNVGTLTVTGTGFAHDDVASWLESLAAQKVFTNPYFSTSTESFIGTRPIVTFASTASITSSALSHRYDKAGS